MHLEQSIAMDKISLRCGLGLGDMAAGFGLFVELDCRPVHPEIMGVDVPPHLESDGIRSPRWCRMSGLREPAPLRRLLPRNGSFPLLGGYVTG